MQTAHARRAGLVQALLLTILLAGAFLIDTPSPQISRSSPGTSLAESRPAQDLPDFAAIRDVEEKKQTFFDFLQPYIDAKNAEVRQQRQRLVGVVEKLAAGYVLSPQERTFLMTLSRDYDVSTDNVQDPAFLELLLHRVDVLPPSLVLAQAANESAWGTSRFAQEGYSFFGQWCYREGCGLVPQRRRANASHEVKAFGSIEEAVHAYFMNLNTFPSYQGLRLIRQDLRQSRQPIDGLSLTEGLTSYSERGEDYISELRSMIQFNELHQRDQNLVH